MLVTTASPLMSVAIMRDGYTVAAGGVDGRNSAQGACIRAITFSVGKLYVYELRAIKSPKHVLEAHQEAVTCIAEQSSVKVGRLCAKYIEICHFFIQSSRGSLKKSSSKKSG